jgi:hypothetical protein
MNINDLFDEICNADYKNLDKFVSALLEAFHEESDDSFEISNLEELPLNTSKKLVDKILDFRDSNSEFVESAMAQIGNKPIISSQGIEIVKYMVYKPNDGDSDSYNASKCGRASIALNREISPAILQDLAVDRDWEIVYRLVMNESLNSKILLELAYSLDLNDDLNNEEIFATIALHKNSDLETLQYLATSIFENVRASVLLNLNTTPEIIKKVSKTTSLKFPNFQTSYCWWDTPTSNWANVTMENKEKLSIIGFI